MKFRPPIRVRRRPRNRRAPHVVALWLFVLAAMILTQIIPIADHGAARAQDRTAVTTLRVTGDEKLAKDLESIVAEEDRDKQATGPAITLLQRAQGLKSQMEKALASRGYYGGTVRVLAAGRDVDDPAILDAIEATPAGGRLAVDVTVETGTPYKVSTIRFGGPAGEAATRAAIDRGPLPLSPGSVADAASILRMDEEILRQLQSRGHALAKIGKRTATVDHAARTMDIDYAIEAGPPARMGRVTFSGTQTVETDFLQRRVPFKTGEPYQPEKIDELRDSITGLGLFTSVRIKRADRLDPDGTLPMEVEVQDRLPRTFGFGASYETSNGFAIGGFWLHRNLFGEGESLRLAAEINRIGTNSIKETGFVLSAGFRKPDWWRPHQDAYLQLQAIREYLDAYDRQAIVLAGGFERRFSKQLTGRIGLALESSRVDQNDERRFYQLVGIPMAVIWDRTDNPLEPTKGFRLAADVAPYVDVLNSPGKPFIITRITGSTYFDLLGEGRTVIAARASIGLIPGLGESGIPPDKRFYAGGGGSVRGYAYQSVGPRDADRDPLGGTSLFEASVELRQRIGKNWGAVAFIDAGNVYDSLYPTLNPMPRVGAGVGVRYYTDFGPIRADIAMPLNRRPGDDLFGLYVSLGQAF